MTKEKNLIYIILVFSLFFHIICVNFYPVNFEFIFFEASSFIKEGFKKEIASQFFDMQANTFLFSFVISFFSIIFPFIEPVHIGKIISLSSFIFISLAALNLLEKKTFSNSNNFNHIGYFLVFLILNPLIWVFGYRATPDVISVALAFYGFSIIYKYPKNNNYLYFAAIILGFATSLKVLTGIYLIAGMMLVKFSYIKKNFTNCLIIAILYAIIPLVYFSITYYNFNFLLFTPYYQSVLTSVYNPALYLNNLILYLSFLFIFSTPILTGNIIINIKNFSVKSIIINAPIYLIAYYLGSTDLIPSDEMNFGFFSNYLNSNILNGLLYCCSYSAVLLMYFKIRRSYFIKDFLSIRLLFVVIVYLLIIASSLASQRYLIVILPLFYFIFRFYIYEGFKLNLLFLLVICVPANILLVTNQYLSGSVSSKMVKYINENNLMENVCPNAIGVHAGHEFPIASRDRVTCALKDLKILKGNGDNDTAVVHSITERIFFLKKEVYLSSDVRPDIKY